MAQILYLLWDSNKGVCTTRVPMMCDCSNARPASIVPQYFPQGTDDVEWIPYDNVGDEWTTKTGARNGIMVSCGNTAYLFDIHGDASSDEVTNSPYAKLAAWEEACCNGCDAVGDVNGEYEGDYPALPGTQFCKLVTITGVTDYPTAYDINMISLTIPEGFLNSDVQVVSYNAGTDVLVVKLCLSVNVTSTGYPLGFPSTWTFANA